MSHSNSSHDGLPETPRRKKGTPPGWEDSDRTLTKGQLSYLKRREKLKAKQLKKDLQRQAEEAERNPPPPPKPDSMPAMFQEEKPKSESRRAQFLAMIAAKRVEKYPGSRAMAKRLAASCYKLVPKFILSNVQFRAWILQQAMDRPHYQMLMRKWCSENVLFFISTFVWSLDTRDSSASIGTTAPFISFACQDEAILAIRNAIQPPAGGRQHDVVIEKSRDMGATWIIVLVFLWFWLFSPERLEFFLMSYKEALVDGGGKSLFGKLDFAIQHLPSWLLPRHERTKMLYKNLDTGSTIEGESTTARSGTGGRYTAMGFDEYPLVDDAESLFVKTADCSRCRIFNGTHQGTHTQFYRLTLMKEADGIKKVRLHWSQHPWKSRGLYRIDPTTGDVQFLDSFKHPSDYEFIRAARYPVRDGQLRSPWYDRECKRRGWNKQAIAQELDIDAHAAGQQFFEPVEIWRLIDEYAEPALHRGYLKDGKFIASDDGHLLLWTKVAAGKQPSRGRFGIGCDIASGTMGKFSTNSCASVVNLDTGEKVAQLVDARLKPHEFALAVRDLAKFFHDAIVVWENNGPGSAFRQALMVDLKYYNVYFRKSSERTVAPKLTKEPGVHPSAENKLLWFSHYREALSSGEFLNRSEEALAETLNFVFDGNTVAHSLELVKGNPSGARANHGDIATADVLANLLLREDGKVREKRKGGGEVVDPLNPPRGSMAYRDWLEERESNNDGWGND